MAELLRKFYKITGLHNVFELTNGQYYSTNSFIDTFQSAYNQKINEHTVLFITCDEQDEDKYVYTHGDLLFFDCLFELFAFVFVSRGRLRPGSLR